MNNNYLNRIYFKLAGAVMLVVLLALAANAAFSHIAFERALVPQMARKMASVSSSIRALIVKAVDSGIPFNEIYGIEQRFDDVKREMPEVAYVALSDPEGKLLSQRMKAPEGIEAYAASPAVLGLLDNPGAVSPATRVGTQYIVSLPVIAGTQRLGVLHLGVDLRFVDDIVLDMLYDVLVVLVVSLFVTLELLHYMAGARLDTALRALGETFERGAAGDFAKRVRAQQDAAFGTLLKLMETALARVNAQYSALVGAVEAGRNVPAHERLPGLAMVQTGVQRLALKYRFGDARETGGNDVGQLAKVRTPLFVFILAEELTRPFLPAYVQDLVVPMPWLSAKVVVGLPIALFMLIVALAQPFVGVYCERVGHRKTMLIGAGIAAVGFLASAMAYNVLDLLLWRSLCAVGYAMVFVAGQAFVLDHAAPANRAKSFALFVGAIMAATVCGPSIGGILADNIGVRPTLVLSALMAAGSLAVIRQLPELRARAGKASARLPKLSEIFGLVCSPRFMAVTGLAAMPAKMLLTGLCFYLMPLYVLSIGSTQAMAGRLLMTYAVAMVVLGPLTAGLATTRERMHWLVGGGLMVSGLGGLVMMAGDSIGWLFAAVALVGLGQSMSISAQSALVSEHCGPEIGNLGEGTVYGVYRLLERIGNAIGPLLAAGLLHWLDYRLSFVAFGLLVLLAGASFLVATRRHPQLALASA